MPNYPKLVRDRIPEIIKEKEGKDVPVRILEDAEYMDWLMTKLGEEAAELKEAAGSEKWLEEMADVFEVIYAILKAKGSDIEKVVAVQKEKREKRGGFEKKILMLGE
jgi:predicted house-cleaning noncanonical NTP pyrophosphatase (MazG superfamily)